MNFFFVKNQMVNMLGCGPRGNVLNSLSNVLAKKLIVLPFCLFVCLFVFAFYMVKTIFSLQAI